MNNEKFLKAEYYKKNKTLILKKMKVYYEKDKEKHKRTTQKDRLRRRFFPHLTSDQAFVEYNRLLELQNNVCAICKNPETKKDPQFGKICLLAVDHDHLTGKVRGLLCFLCNTNLGRVERNLKLILNYLGININE